MENEVDTNSVRLSVVAPRVSVVMAFHRPDSTLPLAIKSVVSQDFADWELILVRDGAPYEFAESLATSKYPNIRLIGDDRQLGLAARLNEGVLAAKGNYIARLDSDDAMCPNRLSRQVGFLDENPDIDVLASVAYVMDCSGRVMGVTPAPVDIVGSLKKLKNPIVHPAVMMRRSTALTHMYDERLKRTEDLDLWVRSLDTHNVFVSPEPLVFYRICGLQKSTVLKVTLREECQLIGRYVDGRGRRAQLWTATVLKFVAKTILNLSGLGERVQQRRWETLEESHRAAADAVIARMNG
ncbi:MAG: glycosyltransferase [Dietzia maris]